MSLLLKPRALSGLRRQYRDLRRHRRAGPVTALLYCALWLLGWTLLRFEGPAWQRLLLRLAAQLEAAAPWFEAPPTDDIERP